MVKYLFGTHLINSKILAYNPIVYYPITKRNGFGTWKGKSSLAQ